MDRDSKIYVAGHAGLVGSALIRQLQAKRYKNIIVRPSGVLDLRRQLDVEKFFAKERPQYVFLAAGKVGGIYANDTYKAEFIYDNIMIVANVINLAYKFGVKKLLNLGSSCIYPKLAPQPLKEEYLLSGPLEPTNESYAIAKIAAIKLCRYYNFQYKTNFISVMPTNLYGKGDNFDLKTGHALPALIRKFHLAKLLLEKKYHAILNDLNKFGNYPAVKKNNVKVAVKLLNAHLASFGIYKDAVVIWGTGEPYREFLYSDDLADACIFLMNKYDSSDIGEFVNIGLGKDMKIKDMGKIIKDIVGFKGEIRFDLTKPDGTPRKLLNVDRMSSLGWVARTELKSGIRLTYNYYLGHTA
ncbi:MAG: GDP-L-fucose synthase [Candidatus Omnitrophica bacterium]|nr:GDP-L-fucose synthase [Candidatus Omnitrophota bacterium]MBU1924542.1 GDP-L-fucose synthase [Candidatus Omnitrophota bacterium]